MPLHHSLGFPSMILEGGVFWPHDPPWIRPWLKTLRVENLTNLYTSKMMNQVYPV